MWKNNSGVWMKQLSNLKVFYIGVFTFCIIILAGYLIQKNVSRTENFEIVGNDIIPWNDDSYEYQYSFVMTVTKNLEKRYLSDIQLAYNNLRDYARKQFDTNVDYVSQRTNSWVNVTNKLVPIYFQCNRKNKATRATTQSKFMFVMNLNKINEETLSTFLPFAANYVRSFT